MAPINNGFFNSSIPTGPSQPGPATTPTGPGAAETPPVNPELYQKVLAYAEAQGEVVRVSIPVPTVEQLVQRGCALLVDLSQRKAELVTLPEATGFLLSAIGRIVKDQISAAPRPGTSYRPKRETIPGAVRNLIAGRRKHQASMVVVRLDEGRLLLLANELDVLNRCAASFYAAADDLDDQAARKAVVLQQELQDAFEVLEPMLRRDPDMARDFQESFSHMKDRYLKASETKKRSTAREEVLREQLKEEVGDEVRAEVKDALARDMVKRLEDKPSPPGQPAVLTAPQAAAAAPAAARRARPRAASPRPRRK